LPDYAKITVTATYSKNSDYSSPKVSFAPAADTFTPDEYDHYEVEADTGGGTTVTTSKYATVTRLIVKNNDATNYVTATFRSAGNSGVDNILRVHAGAELVVSDFTAANNLTLAANSAAVECEIFIAGT